MTRLRVQKIQSHEMCSRCKLLPVCARGLCSTCCTRLRRSGELSLIASQMPEQLTSVQMDVLAGLMLGDGCLFKYKPSHKPYLAITRSVRDIEYLKWTQKIYNPFISREIFIRDTYDKRTQKEYHQCFLTTRHASAFENSYNEWYSNGKKVLPNNIELNPLVMAVWFCDGGWIGYSCSKNRLKIKLSTHCFAQEEVSRLRNQLSNMLDVEFTTGRDNGAYFILGADTATRKFISTIDSVFPESMVRKAIWRNPTC